MGWKSACAYHSVWCICKRKIRALSLLGLGEKMKFMSWASVRQCVIGSGHVILCGQLRSMSLGQWWAPWWVSTDDRSVARTSALQTASGPTMAHKQRIDQICVAETHHRPDNDVLSGKRQVALLWQSDGMPVPRWSDPDLAPRFVPDQARVGGKKCNLKGTSFNFKYYFNNVSTNLNISMCA